MTPLGVTVDPVAVDPVDFCGVAFAFLAAALRIACVVASQESRPVVKSPLRNRQPSTPTTSPLSTLTRPFHRSGDGTPTPREIRTATTDGSRPGPGAPCPPPPSF